MSANAKVYLPFYKSMIKHCKNVKEDGYDTCLLYRSIFLRNLFLSRVDLCTHAVIAFCAKQHLVFAPFSNTVQLSKHTADVLYPSHVLKNGCKKLAFLQIIVLVVLASFLAKKEVETN